MSRKGSIYKENSFLLILDYSWQDHMLVGAVAKAIADSPMTHCVCV